MSWWKSNHFCRRGTLPKRSKCRRWKINKSDPMWDNLHTTHHSSLRIGKPTARLSLGRSSPHDKNDAAPCRAHKVNTKPSFHASYTYSFPDSFVHSFMLLRCETGHDSLIHQAWLYSPHKVMPCYYAVWMYEEHKGKTLIFIIADHSKVHFTSCREAFAKEVICDGRFCKWKRRSCRTQKLNANRLITLTPCLSQSASKWLAMGQVQLTERKKKKLWPALILWFLAVGAQNWICLVMVWSNVNLFQDQLQVEHARMSFLPCNYEQNLFQLLVSAIPFFRSLLTTRGHM